MLLKTILFFILAVSIIACDNKDILSDSRVDNYVIKSFEKDANYIFGDHILARYSFSSYNADRLIFQIKGGDSDIDFLNNINSSLSEKGWFYKEKYKESYIYCDEEMNQLELVPPVNLDSYGSIGEGQSLNQLVGYWNIGFIHSRHKRYVCNISN